MQKIEIELLTIFFERPQLKKQLVELFASQGLPQTKKLAKATANIDNVEKWSNKTLLADFKKICRDRCPNNHEY